MADGDNTTKTVSVEEFEKVKGQLQNWQAKATDYEKTLERFKGIDIEKLKASAEELEILRKEEAKHNPDKLEKWKESEVAKIRSEVAKQLKDAEEKAARYEKVNKELTVTDKVFAAISPRFNDDTADIVKDYIRKYGDLDESGNLIFKNDDGTPRFKNGNESFTADDFGNYIAQKHPSLAKATFTGGAKQPGQPMKTGANYDSIKTLADLNRLPNAAEVWAAMPLEKKAEIGRNTRL